MTVDELRGQVQALQAQVAELRAAQTAAEGPSKGVSSDKPREFAPRADVPTLTKLSEVGHRELNPVARRPHHPKLCQKVDLTGELGHMKVERAPAFVQHEYEVWACAISYFYDALECLKEQISATQLTEARRVSLAVPTTALEHVLEYMLERRDLLITKAEFKDQPGVATAVGLALDGPASTALSSSRVQELIAQAHTVQLTAMVNAQAKAKAGNKGVAPKQKEASS